LPKVLQWYLKDFGRNTKEMLAKVSEFLMDNRMKTTFNEMATGATIIYKPFNWDFTVSVNTM